MMYRLLPSGFTGFVLLVILLTAFAGATAAEDLNHRDRLGMGIHPDAVLPMLKGTDWSKPTGSAQAAPQILGVVASHGPYRSSVSATAAAPILVLFAYSNRGTIRHEGRPMFRSKAPKLF